MSTAYARRKAAGLCGLCGRNPAHPGYACCDPCRMREAIRKDWRLTADEWQAREAIRLFVAAQPPYAPGAAWYPRDAALPEALCIAHCDGWTPITTLPACCGQCGAVVLGEGG